MKLSWISPKVRQGQSNINGAGLIALKNIKKDDMILVQAGEIMNYSDICKKKSKLTDVCFLIDENLLICPILIGGRFCRDGAFLMNHSCDANCGLRGQVTFVAMRDIKRDEEITYDYALTDCHIKDPQYVYKPMRCNCNTKNCRQIIYDTDWMDAKLQKKYEGYFSLHIQRKLSQT